MNLEYYVLAVASGFLTAPAEQMASARAHFRRTVVMDELVGTGRVILAAANDDNTLLSFEDWLAQQRCAGIRTLRVHASGNPAAGVLEHKLAGFAAGRRVLIEIATDTTTAVYTVSTECGRPVAMTAEEFVSLIKQQAAPPFFWDCIAREVNRFNALNRHELVPRAEIETYLAALPGKALFEQWINHDVFQQVQVEALTCGQSFVIPAEYRKYVDQVQPDPFMPEFAPGVYLGVEGDASGTDLGQLVEAQPFAAQIWKRCADPANTSSFPGPGKKIPDQAASEWPQSLREGSAGETHEIADYVIHNIISECEEQCAQPIIPIHLSGVFGPDETERRRIYYRERLQYDLGWVLKGRRDDWQRCLLRRVADSVPAAGDVAAAKAELEAVLADAYDFSVRTEAPFAVTFRLALFLSEKSDSACVPLAQESDFVLELTEAGFAEAESDLLEAAASYATAFSQFGWSASKVFALAAVAVADVFGAMGSWNDLGFEGADARAYDAISVRLFAALNRCFARLLSVG